MIKLIRETASRGKKTKLADTEQGRPAKISRSPRGVVTITVLGQDGQWYHLHIINDADQSRLEACLHEHQEHQTGSSGNPNSPHIEARGDPKWSPQPELNHQSTNRKD